MGNENRSSNELKEASESSTKDTCCRLVDGPGVTLQSSNSHNLPEKNNFQITRSTTSFLSLSLQLIPGLSMMIKTTSISRVPSNELRFALCQCENIQVNGELTENVDIRCRSTVVSGKVTKCKTILHTPTEEWLPKRRTSSVKLPHANAYTHTRRSSSTTRLIALLRAAGMNCFLSFHWQA